MPVTGCRAGRLTMEYAVAIVLAVGVVAAILVLPGREVRLCKRLLGGLVQGKLSVGTGIAWDRLTALGMDVGAAYAQLPNLEEQAAYQEAFIQNFANGFRQSGATLKVFKHWRVQQDGTVAVDYPEKQRTLVFRLSSTKPLQLTGLAWEQP